MSYLKSLKKLPSAVKRLESKLDSSTAQLEAKLDSYMTGLERRLESQLKSDTVKLESKLDNLTNLMVISSAPPLLHKHTILVVARYTHSGGVAEFLYKRLGFLGHYFNIVLLSPARKANNLKLLTLPNIIRVYFTEDHDYKGDVAWARIENNYNAVLTKLITHYNIHYLETHDAIWLPEIQFNLLNAFFPHLKAAAWLHWNLNAEKRFLNILNKQNYTDVYLNTIEHAAYLASNWAGTIHTYQHPYEVEPIYQQPPEGENNVLLISRLAPDKENSIFNLLGQLTTTADVTIYIAGAGRSPEYGQDLQAKIRSTYPTQQFIFVGQIEVKAFLKANPNKFLLIAGVAQVVGEALSFGYPALTTNYITDSKNVAFFITKDNWRKHWQNNFIISGDANFAPYMPQIMNRKPLDDLLIFPTWQEYARIEAVYGEHVKTIMANYE